MVKTPKAIPIKKNLSMIPHSNILGQETSKEYQAPTQNLTKQLTSKLPKAKATEYFSSNEEKKVGQENYNKYYSTY